MNYTGLADKQYRPTEQRSHHTTRVSQSKNPGQSKTPAFTHSLVASTHNAETIARYSNKTSVSHYDIRNNSGPSQLKSYDSSRSRVQQPLLKELKMEPLRRKLGSSTLN